MTNPAEILGLPKPAWAADGVGMLYDMQWLAFRADITARVLRSYADGEVVWPQ